MVIASYTDITKQYEVTLKDGQAIDCTCKGRHYHKCICRHMINANGQVMMEIERAATFLALKVQIEAKEREARETAAAYMRIFNSPW